MFKTFAPYPLKNVQIPELRGKNFIAVRKSYVITNNLVISLILTSFWEYRPNKFIIIPQKFLTERYMHTRHETRSKLATDYIILPVFCFVKTSLGNVSLFYRLRV